MENTTDHREILLFDCGFCHNEVKLADSDKYSTEDYGEVCKGCLEDHFFSCSGCGEYRHIDGSYYYNDENYCQSCYENLDRDGEINYRDIDMTKNMLSSEKGKILSSTRGFGVELEVSYHDKQDAINVSHKLPKYLGISADGSVSFEGLEIQTPVASGKIAEDMINGICETLRKSNGEINKSCGYHVHIDMRDIEESKIGMQLRTQIVRFLWAFYVAFEDVLVSFLPSNRRINGYCKRLKPDYHLTEIKKALDIDELEKIWYRENSKARTKVRKSEGKDESRYRGINLHTLFSESHTEIRFHGGTMNAKKILEWANLHLTIADRAKKLVEGYGVNWAILENTLISLELREKTDLFFAILRLDKTSEDYFQARQSRFMPESKPTVISDKVLSETESLPREGEDVQTTATEATGSQSLPQFRVMSEDIERMRARRDALVGAALNPTFGYTEQRPTDTEANSTTS